MTLETNDLIDKWSVFIGDFRKDEKWAETSRHDDDAREKARVDMLIVLDKFLSGSISIEEFRDLFHRKTAREWNIFGLKGMAGGMFLNTLVKYISDHDTLASFLKSTLSVPSNSENAEIKMRDFSEYLHSLILSGDTQKRIIQPARIPFFISAWWHIQGPETWPIFYPVDRHLLEDEGVYAPTDDVIGDYFQFRRIYSEIREKIGTSPWEMFNFSLWLHERKLPPRPPTIIPPSSVLPPVDPPSPETQEEKITHTQVQWMLAKIGTNLGLKVWVAKNDWSSEYNGEKLGSFSIDKFPDLGMDRAVQNKMEYIDVVWFKGAKNVVAAFEVEHTTSIISGILRLSDLTLMSPNINFRFYIIVPEERLKDIRNELRRPTFQNVGLHEMCGFFSEEALRNKFDGIMEFAASYTVIERTLAEKVSQSNW